MPRSAPTRPASPVSSIADRTDGTTRARVSRNVIFLGLTSLLTDASSEALTAVLPLYVLLELRMSPMQFGLLDGLWHGATAIARVAGGCLADRGGRHRLVAGIGYALSALCKLGLLLVGAAWGALATVLLLDRLGKGVRTAPRDALLALSSEPARLGESFGVHRAFDTLGAILGPLMAFAILTAAPGAYDAVFVASFAVAVLGLAVLGLFVEDRSGRRPYAATVRTAGRLGGLLTHRPFRALVAAGGLLGLLTASDALIYLVMQQRGGVPTTVFPLLFVATGMVYLLLAAPAGRLSDRWGRHRVFLCGHVLVIAIYALLSRPTLGPVGLVGCVVLLGAYYAATDGVLAALASSILPRRHLTTGLAVVGTTTALARLLASTLFGTLWTWYGPVTALLLFAAGLAPSVLLGALILRADRPRAVGEVR